VGVVNPVRAFPVQRFVLYGEPWETYARLVRLFDERRHLRITFDRGALELMTFSLEHERSKHLLGRLIWTLAEELDLPIACLGSLTLKRRRKQRGLEPDECFWIQNEAKVRTLQKFDWRRDPPPDLVLEVDISRSSLNRLGIYAALGVPEVWRFDGTQLEVHVLGADGKYARRDHSAAFPFLRPAELLPFLAQYTTLGENGMVRAFRTWVRQQKAAGWQMP
jgi:Uma2 family endonuclease